MTPSSHITEVVTSWPGVSAGHGSRGEWSFRVGRREIGHLHGDRVAHFSFKRELGARLRAEGRVEPHPITSAPGLDARRIDGPEDVAEVIELLRLNYERLVAAYGLPTAA
jgi:hypothetical protein